MPQENKPSLVILGKNGYLFVDGVRVAKFIPERQSIQFLDRDRRRCSERGSETVEVRLSDLAQLSNKK